MMTTLDGLRSCAAYLGAAAFGLALTTGCIAQAPEPSEDEESEDTSSKSKESDEASGKESENDSEEPSKELSELPKPRACKAFAPKVAFEDTNPSSKTHKKELSPQDFKGRVSLWIPTFDCNC